MSSYNLRSMSPLYSGTTGGEASFEDIRAHAYVQKLYSSGNRLRAQAFTCDLSP